MEQLRLGATALKVSRLCLGCMTFATPAWRPWVLDEQASRPIIARARELGVTFFDTADMYSAGVGEQVVGRALRDFARRSDVVIATKLFHPMSERPNDRGLSRAHIMESIDRSLRNLGTDHVDRYQIHAFDPDTPVDETLQAVDDVVRAGKARCLGAATMARVDPRALRLSRRPDQRPPWRRGSSPSCCSAPASAAGRGSSRCRTTTTWSTARRSAR